MSNNWMEKHYPLQRLQVTVQGRKDNTLIDLAAGLRMVADELERGVSVSESFDDDFGYRFHIELSQDTLCRLDASGFHAPDKRRGEIPTLDQMRDILSGKDESQ